MEKPATPEQLEAKIVVLTALRNVLTAMRKGDDHRVAKFATEKEEAMCDELLAAKAALSTMSSTAV